MMDIDSGKPLKELLAEQLSKGVPFTFYHYSTTPSKSTALFSAPPHGKSERTYCESHLLAASIASPNTGASQLPEELLVLAIEVLIYSTRNLTTIFVSKADSTGYLAELQLPRSQSGSPLKAICGTFVSWLARERQREGKKLVVSLFARAQDQYLFPASIENKDKHVLDDRGLVKWWCRVLDPIIGQYKAEKEQPSFAERLVGESNVRSDAFSQEGSTAKGYLVIPGFEQYDTLRYTPAPSVPNTPRRWVATHPLLQIAPHPAAPPRCLVPHFPDDPKSRFLDELDEELPDRGTDAILVPGGTPSRSNGQWKSVKTMNEFWEFMAFRQECSSGRIVGFIWVVITPPKPSIPEDDEEEPSQDSNSQSLKQSSSQETSNSPKKRKAKKRVREPRIKYGPIPLVIPKIKQSSSTLSDRSNASSQSSQKQPLEQTPYYTWPVSSRGTICFSPKNYDRAHEVLLQQNFANRRAAAQSTRKWKEEIGVLGGMDSWGWTVVGTKEQSASKPAVSNGSIPVTVMGVRKKRKPETSAASTPQVSSTASAQVLGEGLVRKKAKIEPTPVGDANGVNTLSTGLVRKKPKV